MNELIIIFDETIGPGLHYPAPPVPACPTSGAPVPDPDAEDKAACAAPDVETLASLGWRVKRFGAMEPGDSWLHKRSGYDICTDACGLDPEMKRWIVERIPAPTPPASPPAPVQGDVEGIVEQIVKAADAIADKLWGDRPPAGMVRDSFVQALREHLPALADGARLMRLADRGMCIRRERDGQYSVMVINPDSGGWWIPHDVSPRFPTLPSALAAAEQIGGA